MDALLKALWSDDSGQDIIEYVVLAALISVVAIVLIRAIGTKVQAGYQSVDNAMTGTPFGGGS